MIQDYYRSALKQELLRRCEANKSYSLRAFAKQLKMDPGQLSRVMNGKQNISTELAQLIAEKVFKKANERELFVASVGFAVSKNPEMKELALKRMAKFSQTDRNINLSLEAIRVISDWYHVAILDMTALDDFDPDPTAIAGRLGITDIEAKLAIERLIQLGLLERKNQKLRKTTARLVSPTDIPSASLRKFHRQMIAKASDSLELQSVDKRYIVGRTMAISKEALPQYKELIEQFLRQVSELNINSKTKNALYQVNVQFFDLCNEKNKKR